MYLDEIKCTMNRNACCRKLLSYLCAWMAKLVCNPHESHNHLHKMFQTKVLSIYLHHTDCQSSWINVHQHAEGSMCLCRNAPDTHHNRKRSPQLFLQECVSLPLHSSHTLSSSLQTSPFCVNVHCFLTLSEIVSLLLPFSWKKILQLADPPSPVWNPEGRSGASVPTVTHLSSRMNVLLTDAPNTKLSK